MTAMSYSDAMTIISDLAAAQRQHRPLRRETVPLVESVGRVCCSDVLSPRQLPLFDVSAMDGFAVTSALTASASPTSPIRLPVLGCIAAGDAAPVCTASSSLSPALCCYEIMTGAPFPSMSPLKPGAAVFDACVRIEDVTVIRDDETAEVTAVELTQPVRAWANRRRAGEDIALQSVLLRAGDVLCSQHVLVLAAVGVMQVDVWARPVVAVVSTGRELQSQVPDANAPYLIAALTDCGVAARHIATVYDDPADFQLCLQRIAAERQPRCDVVITTGAVSMGKFDFIPASLRSLHARILFHKLRVKPGHPALLAALPDSPPDCGSSLPVFALPGNPVAVAACFRFLLLPFLQQLLSVSTGERLTATLATEERKGKQWTLWAKGRLSCGEGGRQEVQLVKAKSSLMLQPLLDAESVWVLLPEGEELVAAGSVVQVVSMQATMRR